MITSGHLSQSSDYLWSPYTVVIISLTSYDSYYLWSPPTSLSTKSPVVTLQYGGSIWLPLVTHAYKAVSETEGVFMTSFSVFEIGYGEQRRLLSFIMYKK